MKGQYAFPGIENDDCFAWLVSSVKEQECGITKVHARQGLARVVAREQKAQPTRHKASPPLDKPCYPTSIRGSCAARTPGRTTRSPLGPDSFRGLLTTNRSIADVVVLSNH
jgi:hypothetical protein